MTGALAGVRVLDLGRGVAAPYAAMLLAEQGADVLRVEPPSRDRLHGTAAYRVLNRSKRLLLEEEAPAGLDRIRSLAVNADLVIVDLPESIARERGLTYGTLSANHNDLVY